MIPGDLVQARSFLFKGSQSLYKVLPYGVLVESDHCGRVSSEELCLVIATHDNLFVFVLTSRSSFGWKNADDFTALQPKEKVNDEQQGFLYRR